MAALSDYNIYAQQLGLLGFGIPLWRPSPLNDYQKVKLGDVGYIRKGSFHRLFNAATPATDPSQTRGVPGSFIQLQLDDQSYETSQRLPGAIHSRHMRLKGVDIDIGANPSWVEAGATVRFESAIDQGAMLVTKDVTLQEDALQLGFLETYAARNYASWLDFANNTLGRGIKLEDLILVTGYDVTSQFALAAFSGGSIDYGIAFKAAYPPVASASISVWGQWQTSMSMFQHVGPPIPLTPSLLAPSWEPPGAGTQEVNILQEGGNIHPAHNQCVFLRGFRIRKRVGLFPKVIKAGAGPHDLGPGHRDDENVAQLQRCELSTGPELDKEREECIVVEPIVDTQPFKDPLEPCFQYIFEESHLLLTIIRYSHHFANLQNSDAEIALVHDYDIFAFMNVDEHQGRNIDGTVQNMFPNVVINSDGAARISVPSSSNLREYSTEFEAQIQDTSHPATGQHVEMTWSSSASSRPTTPALNTSSEPSLRKVEDIPDIHPLRVSRHPTTPHSSWPRPGASNEMISPLKLSFFKNFDTHMTPAPNFPPGSVTLPTTSGPPSPQVSHKSTSTIEPYELDPELKRLRDRVRDLELMNDLVRLRIAELETVNKSHIQNDTGLRVEPTEESSTSIAHLSPATHFTHRKPDITPIEKSNHAAALPKSFLESQRSGNVLCAWHRSRRERRAYPPRSAPPQTLNCGCTYAEAFFEESLARNGVGAIHPGESVRMDPGLRNPLLKLLEKTYGYQDGDLERTTTPNSGAPSPVLAPNKDSTITDEHQATAPNANTPRRTPSSSPDGTDPDLDSNTDGSSNDRRRTPPGPRPMFRDLSTIRSAAEITGEWCSTMSKDISHHSPSITTNDH